MRPPFFYLPPPHPGCSGILSATRSGTTPPTHRQSPTRRHKRPTLACPTTSSPAPKPTAHTHLLPRLPAPPSPTDTKKRLPAPEPPPYIRILARTIRIPPSEPAGKKHPLPATSSTSAPPGKAPPRTSLRPHAPARTREKLRSPPPHIRILAHLHLSPTPCSRAPPKLPLSPPRNARKNVTPHPAGRLPAPSRTSKCLPSPAGTKKAAAR